jgi:glutaminyl-peptide cyclotransferase
MPITFLIALLLSAAAQKTPATIPVQGVEIQASYPHDTQAFTQGLFFADGQLYESTGQLGRSTIRRVRLSDGKVLQSATIPADQFRRGQHRLGQADCQPHLATRHRLSLGSSQFPPARQLPLSGEGWGLTQDGRSLILSDGTAALRFLDPATFKERGALPSRWGPPVTS